MTNQSIFGDVGAAPARNTSSDDTTSGSLSNERTLATFGTGAVMVTTHRVRAQYETSTQSALKSIMLEQVASCAVAETSNPALLVLAALCLFASPMMGRDTWIVGVVLALVLVIAYFVTRRQILAIASAGTEIRVELHGHSKGEARAFIETLEHAKDARYRAAWGR